MCSTPANVKVGRRERQPRQTIHTVYMYMYVHVRVNCTSHDHMLMLDGEAFDVPIRLHLYVQNKEMFAYVVHVNV